MASRYVDKDSILQVIGAIIKSPYLLEQSDKYFFNVEDFVEPFHKTIFGAINNLKALGARKIEILDVDSFLSKRPSLYKLYNDNKGTEYLVDAMKKADIQKFDYYYNRMKKMTLLRMYDNYGIDVKWLYNPDNILDIRIKQKQEDWLDTTPIESIALSVDKRLEEIKANYVNTCEGENYHAGDGLLALINKLKECPEVGIPLYGPLINTITRGARLKKFYLRSAPTGCVDMDTEYFNGKEWKKISEYSEGDLVLQYNQDGSSSLVKPQEYIKIPCDEMNHFETSKGVNQTICDEHNVVYLNTSRKPKITKIPFKEFKERHLKNKRGFEGTIPTAFIHSWGKGIELSKEQIRLQIAVIADGYFPSATTNYCYVNLKKQKKKDRLIQLLNDANIDFKINDYSDSTGYTTYSFYAPRREKKFTSYWYKCSKEQIETIKDEILLWDGSIDSVGRQRFSSTEKESADFVQFIFSSSGQRAAIHEDIRANRNTCYNVCISRQSPFVSVLSSNKMQINKVKTKDGFKYCFTVNSGMLVLRRNNCINITGNCGKSRMAAADMCNFSCDEIYDLNLQQWVKNGTQEPSLFITTELDKEEIQTMLLCFLSGVQEDNIINGRYEEGEEERVVYAAKVIERSPLWIECLSDFSLRDIENVIKRAVRDNDVKYVALMKIGRLETLSSNHWGIAA